MTGDPRAPDGRGSVHITKGRVGHIPWNVIYENIQGEMVLEGNRLSVRDLSATSGKGRLTAQGDMALSNLKPGDFQLNLNLEDFSVMDSPNLHLDASGRADLVRAGTSLSLTGDLIAEELEVFVNFATAGRGRVRPQLTEADSAMVLRTFGPKALQPRSTLIPDALRMAAIDVNVTAIQDAWIRSRTSPRLAAEISGQIRAKKAPDQKFEYFGEINAIEGRSFVESFGRRFDIQEGELILEGDPSRARFNAQAMNEITPSNDPSQTAVEITLKFEGSPRDYEFQLSSDPALPNSEITTLLATGATSRNMRPADTANKEAAGIALQVGLTGVTGALEESAQQAVGLDVVQIRQDGLRGMTLVAGEYVKPRVYLGLRQPVLFETEEVGQATDTGEDIQLELEYLAHRRLSLDFLGEGDAFRALARTRYAY
jgi:translocation and assembly module TamB